MPTEPTGPSGAEPASGPAAAQDPEDRFDVVAARDPRSRGGVDASGPAGANADAERPWWHDPHAGDDGDAGTGADVAFLDYELTDPRLPIPVPIPTRVSDLPRVGRRPYASPERATDHGVAGVNRPTGDVRVDSVVTGAPGAATTGGSVLGVANFRRLLAAQVVSAFGDWIGVVAVIAIAARIARADAEFATSLVMIARVLPGFVFAPVAGVLVDRWDRRRTMICCDIARGVLLALLPFVSTVWMLVALSFALEVFSMLWGPAKEALVPSVVRPWQLATANSLGLGAAYGTFPLASLAFAALAGVAAWLASLGLPFLEGRYFGAESLAVWLDCLTFFVSAYLVASIVLRADAPRTRTRLPGERFDAMRTWHELGAGWSFIGRQPTVRVIVTGLGVAVLGGAAVVPLGASYATSVLHGGPAAYGLVMTAVGVGAAVGVGVLLVLTRNERRPLTRLFTWALLMAGVALSVCALVNALLPALGWVALFGMGAGAAYICGFTALGQVVDDDLRGRVFASLMTIMRFCLLVAVTAAPLIAAMLGGIVRVLTGDGHVSVGVVSFEVSGTQLVFLFGGMIVAATGWWTRSAWAKSTDAAHASASTSAAAAGTAPGDVVDVTDSAAVSPADDSGVWS